ncbi:MAG: CDP-alcohol phosphatidyltransferase family protein, partial [Acidimicrobiales bacterium]
ALATWANAVTIARLVLSPVLVALIVGRDNPASWPALVLWIALAATDGVDGWLARRHGTTRSGAFLDPLADKVLVLSALAALAASGRFWWFPVALIAIREIGISMFRSYWGSRGLAVPATKSAKVKMVMQDLAVGFALLPSLDDSSRLADGLLWAAVGLTLVTGIQYLQAGSRSTRTSGSA